jgi:hypothetical protein
MLNIYLSLGWQAGRAVFSRRAGFGSRARGTLVFAFFILCLRSGIFFCHGMPLLKKLNCYYSHQLSFACNKDVEMAAITQLFHVALSCQQQPDRI